MDTYYKVLRTTLEMFRKKAIKRFSQGPKLTKSFPNQNFFPESAIGHLWCIFVDTAEKILTHCRENLAQYPNLTENTYLFFPKKSIVSQNIPLDTQNAVWQSCPKIFVKIPKTFISMSKSNKKNLSKDIFIEMHSDIWNAVLTNPHEKFQ